jgi:hypothetical protein
MVDMLIPIFAFLLWVSVPLRAEVNADGTETPDQVSATDSKMTAADGKDGKSTAAAPEQETEYKNWIELGIGGVITHGDTAQFEQEHHTPGDQVYGGITDMHYEHGVGEATLTIDGHALWDINDYDITVKLEQPKFGYLAAGFTEYRTWYDGNGGFFPPHGGTWFPPFFPEMHIDRGDAWVELGLRIPDWPEITIRYSHEFRDGMKDSTTWGDTELTGGGNVLPGPTRKIVPSFRDIDETRDIVSLDVSKTFGNTDVLLGMRYEHNDNNDTLNMERGAGQLPPVVAPPGEQRFITQRDNSDTDLFSGHAITETRFTDNFWFTAGYSYTTLNNDITGSRIFGTHFDSAFGEPVPTLGQRDTAFVDLAGMEQVDYHVVNANLFWMPLPNLSVISGFRYTHEDQDTSATYLALETVENTPPFTPNNPDGGFHFGPATPASGERQSDYDRFAQRLDLRYTGIKELLLYAEGEWEEESGHVFEVQSDEGLEVDKDTHFLGQKYVIGATWYPMTRMDIAAQYYHQIADYDNDIFESMHQRLIGQDWDTDNANIRITVRPKVPAWLGTLVLASRYDFTRTAIDSKWFHEGEVFQEEQTGVITKHIISDSITWNPLARFYLQADGSVVLNQTDTPANNISLSPNTSPTVVDFRNDYWTVTASAGFLLDDKTDLHADYSFFCANDHFKNSRVAVAYGLGATEHTVSAGIARQLNKQVRLTLKYTYFNYDDSTFGGHNDYQAHSIFSGLQYRF